MAELFLIRHGQASFGKEDYDQLSSKGEQQSRLLGQNWPLPPFESIKWVSGAMVRHQQTANGFLKGAGLSGSKLIVDAGFNEFDHLQILYRQQPSWESRHEMTRELASFSQPEKQFQQVFSQAIVRWVSGEYNSEYTESWVDFQQRCWQALLGLTAQAYRDSAVKTLMVFTSGGPISAIVQQVLSLSDRDTFAVNEVLANTGVTRLLFSGGKISLSYLNNFSHLQQDNENLVTYR